MKLVKNILKGIDIKTLVVKNMTLTFINENERIEKHTALKNLDVNISGVAIDSTKNLGCK